MTAKYKSQRDKMVKRRNTLVDVRVDGSVHIQVKRGDGETFSGDLSEEEAAELYQTLGDVFDWTGGDD